MANVVETPISFGARDGQRIIALTVQKNDPEDPKPLTKRIRAGVLVILTRDDGRGDRSEDIRVAVLPDTEAVPADADDVVQGATQAQIDAFIAVGQLIWQTAVAKAQEPK